jgi:hypothetical protein
VSASPYRLPEHQYGLINPWREPAPPHGGPPADSCALHELHRLRQRYHFESRDDRTWGIVGLIGCASLLLLVPLGLVLGGWICLLALKVGLLPVGMGYMVFHLRGNAKRIWKDAYTAMYFKLATTGLPLLIADAAHAASAATGQLAARPDLVQAVLHAAKYDLAAERAAQPGAPLALAPVNQRLGLAARARFAAVYDFFFHPQEEFHAELERLRAARPAVEPAAG